MGARLVGDPNRQYLKRVNGTLTVNDGGKLYYYEPGTTTPKTTWRDVAKAATHTNPILLDSEGRVPYPVFVEGMYDVLLTDSDDTTQESVSDYGDNKSAVLTDLSSNKVSNNSFETDSDADGTPDNWTVAASTGTIARTTADNYHGTASMLATGTDTNDYFESDLFEVSEGRALRLSFDLKASNAAAIPTVEFRWHDEDQTYISTSQVYDSDRGVTPTAWSTVEGLTSTPAATARYARVRITPNNQATTYNCSFDDVRVEQLPTVREALHLPQGLILENSGVDADHDIKVLSGSVLDATYTTDIILASDITKQIDATWAIGDNQGMMDSASSLQADTGYAIWAIKDSSDGTVDILCSESFTSPTLPTGFDLKRYLGTILTDASSNIRTFVMTDTYTRLLSEPMEIINNTSVADETANTGTLPLPPNIVAHIYGYILSSSNTDDELYLYIFTKGSSEAVTGSRYAWLGVDIDLAVSQRIMREGSVYLDANSQIEYAVNWGAGAGVATIYIDLLGWTDLLRNNP